LKNLATLLFRSTEIDSWTNEQLGRCFGTLLLQTQKNQLLVTGLSSMMEG
jgi:hypothetical protein